MKFDFQQLFFFYLNPVRYCNSHNLTIHFLIFSITSYCGLYLSKTVMVFILEWKGAYPNVLIKTNTTFKGVLKKLMNMVCFSITTLDWIFIKPSISADKKVSSVLVLYIDIEHDARCIWNCFFYNCSFVNYATINNANPVNF